MERKIQIQEMSTKCPLESVFGSSWPYFHSPIREHFQFQAVDPQRLELGSEHVRFVDTIDEHIDADIRLLLGGPDVWRAGCQWSFQRFGIVDGFQQFRLLANSGNDRGCELFRAHLFFGNSFLENVVGMHAVLDRLEPSIVGQFGDIRLTNVD